MKLENINTKFRNSFNITDVQLGLITSGPAKILPRFGLRIQPEVDPDDPVRIKVLNDLQVLLQPGEVVPIVSVESCAFVEKKHV